MTATEATALGDIWTANELMGVMVNGRQEESLAPSTAAVLTTGSNKKGKNKTSVVYGKGVDQDPMLWGVPGHLTQQETEVFFAFKQEIEKRGGEFRETVYSFGIIEGEVWACGRWLRARKFVLEDTIKMVEEATQVRKAAKAVDFYPNPRDALGVDTTLFYAQYPQLYTGATKMGVPVFISKPGILNVDGMECITTLDGILKFHWHVMMHDFARRLHEQKKKNPETFKKFECFCILDLDNLTTSQLSRRALAIVKEQAAIDSICFPKTMSKMLIVNAPTFFAATWRIIKGWLDPRTANKIEVISSRSTMEKRLLEFIDSEQLPSDYGGTGPHTQHTMNESLVGDFTRMETKMMYLRGHGSETIDVKANEKLEVTVYTRSTAGAIFSLFDANNKSRTFVENVTVTHRGSSNSNENELPTSVILNKDLVAGPCKLKVKADSNAGRFSTHNYLLVFSYKDA